MCVRHLIVSLREGLVAISATPWALPLIPGFYIVRDYGVPYSCHGASIIIVTSVIIVITPIIILVVTIIAFSEPYHTACYLYTRYITGAGSAQMSVQNTTACASKCGLCSSASLQDDAERFEFGV